MDIISNDIQTEKKGQLMTNPKECTDDKAKMLIKWFEENKRDMPWRKTKDPYCIWVSEVMLQQTQVVTVIPYYIQFMERFPTITDLANATLEEVHNYWQGLGYYKRGENLWKGAKVIKEKWQGIFPKDPKQIKEIPGIGSYTLGAICSIAYDIPLPAVDGNVMRVMSRWYCLSEDIGIAKNRKVFEEKVMENMPEHPSAFNQGLMELGALICTPKNPKCEECPVITLCKAYESKTVSEYPVKQKKAKQTEEKYEVLIMIKENRIGMLKRKSKGLLANMWGLPMFTEENWKAYGLNELVKERRIEKSKLKLVKHVFSHRKWFMKSHLVSWTKEFDEILEKHVEHDIQFMNKDELEDIPIPTAFMKIIKQKGVKEEME